MKRTELAWAAGFYDGEGCTTVRLRDPHKGSSITMQVGQVDRRPLDRFAEAIGEGLVRGPYKATGKGHQSFYVYRLGTYAGVQRALALLWPYLSEPKREQAERVIEMFENRDVSTKIVARG